MVKVTLRLDKRYRLADGRHPIKLAIARNGQTFYIPLNLSVRESDWDAKAVNHIKNISQKKNLNTYINSQLSQAELTIMDLQSKGLLRQFTNKQLIEYLSSDKKEKDGKQLFKYHADEYIATKQKPNTIEAYEVAIKAVSSYCNYDTLLLKDITRVWVEGFQEFLLNRGNEQHTIVSYITKVRAIYSSAADKGFIDTSFPHIRLKRNPTRKRSLIVEDIKRLINAPCTKIQKRYVDLFLLMFMMRGINMRDLSLLPANAIHNGYIDYNRQKTGKAYSIKIEPEMHLIIDRYKGKEHLIRFFDHHKNPNHYKVFGHTMALALRKVAETFGNAEKISPYYSRHSWASIAIELGASMEMVSAGLGHGIGEAVTQVYVTFQQKQIDELSRKIIDYILK